MPDPVTPDLLRERGLADFATEIPDGLTVAEDQTIGELSWERRQEIDRRGREMDRARARAWASAQTYFVCGGRNA